MYGRECMLLSCGQLRVLECSAQCQSVDSTRVSTAIKASNECGGLVFYYRFFFGGGLLGFGFGAGGFGRGAVGLGAGGFGRGFGPLVGGLVVVGGLPPGRP